MIQRNIIIDIDSAFEIGGSGVSAHTIKCSICEKVEDIPIYELEEEFYDFIKRFIRSHDHTKEKNETKQNELSLDKIHDEAMRIKELLFNLKAKCYPASNLNIAQLKDTLTFIRLLNHAVAIFETFGNCLRYTISKDNYYFLQRCSKCFEITFHREHGKKTAHCVVCWKRNPKEKFE